MATYRTPGVYVEEISLFPPSVAEVKTAVPAFIGYTEQASRRGRDLTNVPTKLRSLLEVRDMFGGEYVPASVEVHVDEKNNYTVKKDKPVKPAKRFYMFEALRLYFDNGGGECYIISVGSYSDSVAFGTNTTGLSGGLKALEKYDEPTIILFPDATLLAKEGEFATLQQKALEQCAKLQDRVAVFDLKENAGDGSGGVRLFDETVTAFRDTIGINNLKYGAAYTPWLFTTYPKTVDFNLFKDSVKDSGGVAVKLDQLSADPKQNALVTAALTALGDEDKLAAKVKTLRTDGANVMPTLADRYNGLVKGVRASTDDPTAKTALGALMDWVRLVAVGIPAWRTEIDGVNLLKDLEAYAKDKLRGAVEGLVAFEKHDKVRAVTGKNFTDTEASYKPYDDDAPDWLSKPVSGPGKIEKSEDPAYDDTDRDNILKMTDGLGVLFGALNEFIDDVLAAADVHQGLTQGAMYDGHPVIGNIVSHIEKELARVPPSGAIAGVYAKVDRTRGVWKAPANVSLNAVSEPTEPIDFFDQEDLNIDVNAGKSINAIRTFAGKGTLVWGARTLAGNDNEWRYVPVRRFFNMVEESVKKSTGWAVFEPNDAKLWTKVKGMIDSYLMQKWREGALQGAVPDDAFFVKVGLGQTMIPQDVLEGRLIVEIGMAVVRPAEFIVLRFMHKMPVS